MRINKNNFKSNKIARGTILSLCVFAGLSSLTNSMVKEDSKYLLLKEINENPSSLLQEVEISTGIETNNNSNLVLLHAVLNNKNLTDIEKSYFYKLDSLISENPYIDKEQAYQSLLDLKIEHTKRPNKYDESVKAIYSPDDNTIYDYQDKTDFNEEIFLHELIHAIFTNSKTINLPKFILEGETELLTNEYVSSTPFIENNTYPFEVSMVKILCEMIGEDKVLEAYTTGDMNIIYSSLSSYNNNYDGVLFIDNAEKVFKSFNENKEVPATEYNNMIIYMDDYFYNKFKDNSEKIEIYEYYKGLINNIYNEKAFKENNEYIVDNGVIIKPYYSKLLKEIYPETQRAYVELPTEKLLKK